MYLLAPWRDIRGSDQINFLLLALPAPPICLHPLFGVYSGCRATKQKNCPFMKMDSGFA
jgi:hypothetical protein